MSSVNDVSDMPTDDKNLIIVAGVQNVLHFRIFDADGKRVVDTDENQLPDKAPQIAKLKSLLSDLWGVPQLSQSDKDRVITAVTSIVSHTLPQYLMPRKSEQTATSKIRDEGVYDVFLCHNSQDMDAVKDIGMKLRAQGLKPWLDEWEVRPGMHWQPALERQIQSIRSAAVFIGKSGIAPLQDIEQEAFLREFVNRLCPVIPVILPDCEETPQLPIFLRGLVWVDFRRREPNPLKQLIWGITGYQEFVGSTLTTLREGESTEQGGVLEISSQEGKVRSDIDEVRLTHPEIQARADIDEIRRSLGDRSLREVNRLAEAILRRMGSREWKELESPPFEKGTVWEVTPPPLGLRLPPAQEQSCS